MPQDKQPEQTKDEPAVSSAIAVKDVLKLLKDEKIEIIGRKVVSERDILSFADLGQTVVVVTADGRKHTLNK